MKYFIALTCVLFALACIGQTAATPLPEADQAETGALELEAIDAVADTLPAEQESTRHKRATCDLLSFTGANHSLCAAHCIARGNRGGFCNGSAVCVCRK